MAEFSLALVHETVSAAVPDRTALIQGDRSWTFREISDRSSPVDYAPMAVGPW